MLIPRSCFRFFALCPVRANPELVNGVAEVFEELLLVFPGQKFCIRHGNISCYPDKPL